MNCYAIITHVTLVRPIISCISEAVLELIIVHALKSGLKLYIYNNINTKKIILALTTNFIKHLNSFRPFLSTPDSVEKNPLRQKICNKYCEIGIQNSFFENRFFSSIFPKKTENFG